MAGIGFELRRAVDEDAAVTTRMRAWVCAGLVASGPWIVTVLLLTYLHLMSPKGWVEGEYALFRGLVTYAAAFSLIVVGAIQVPMIRHIADQLWSRLHGAVLPGYVAAMAVTGLLQAVVGTLFVWHLGLDRVDGMLAVSLYVICTWSWLALNWLGAIRDYDQVLRAYFAGALISAGLTIIPDLRMGLTELLFVFTTGQGVTLLMLGAGISRGLQASDERSLKIVSSTWAMPSLLLIGILYNVGIWLDKVIFWIVDGVQIQGLLRQHPMYDTCSFLAYATVVPALAINLVHAETVFYEHYRAYYKRIEEGHTMHSILQARDTMVRTLRESVRSIIRIQAWITCLMVVIAPELLANLGVPIGAAPTFRILCIGAFFHVLFLLTELTLLYFDSRKSAAIAAGVFFALNLTLPWLSALGTPVFYGLGYSIAALVSLLVAFGLLQRDLEQLEFLTFTRQLRS